GPGTVCDGQVSRIGRGDLRGNQGDARMAEGAFPAARTLRRGRARLSAAPRPPATGTRPRPVEPGAAISLRLPSLFRPPPPRRPAVPPKSRRRRRRPETDRTIPE